MTRHPLYATWRGMIDRCTNPSSPSYYNYGERGIRVCERWSASFDDFCLDMGERPALGYTIDRMENDGDYEPNNCYWATAEQQAANRRPYKRVEPPRKFCWEWFWEALGQSGGNMVWDCRELPPDVLDRIARMGMSVSLSLPRQGDDWGPAYVICGTRPEL